MSTIVYPNLVSCFESQFKETTTTVKLKFEAPTPTPPADANFTDMNTSVGYGNWGLFQINPKEPVEKSFYTQYTSSFSRLSAKSLELCTENLGSESGSDVITDSSGDVSIFSSSSSLCTSNLKENSSSYLRVELEKHKQVGESSKNPRQAERITTNKSKNFPPSLTTMSGPSSLQMRRRREDGRLVIDAVEAPLRNSSLKAERSDGRLRLYFQTGSDSAITTTSAVEEEESENDCGADPEEIKEFRSEMESGMEEFEGELNYEMGFEKFQRLSRCKKVGAWKQRIVQCLEPAYCVAT